MVDLINDGSLIGFWPLNEPSGAPLWKNFSSAYGNHPSGVSYDLNVHAAEVSAGVDFDSAASPWPSTKVIHHAGSGMSIRGLQLLGEHKRISATTSSPFSKMLILGNGSRQQRRITLGPEIANSGFTAGFWVYPNSDSWIDAVSEGGFSTTLDSWDTGYGRTHSLMGQFRNDIGWYMGVSGALGSATPITDSKFGPHQLRAFLVSDVNAGGNKALDTPIESGRYTHMTMTYRYVNGSVNELVLYKEGRVAASGTTSREICFNNNLTGGPDASVFNLGGATDGTQSTSSLEFTSGWGHLVSGVYLFNRVLHEGEVLGLHEAGSLQPNVELRNNTKEVTLFDNDLIAYVEGRSPGWIDSSKNHYNFASERDPGDQNVHYTHDPGPFGVNRVFNDSSTGSEFIVAPSGATFDLVGGAGGFTVCGRFQTQFTVNDREVSMMMSLGSVSAAATGETTPGTVTENTLGMSLSYFTNPSNAEDTIALEVFPLGRGTDSLVLRPSGNLLFRFVNQHLGITYDSFTNGIALYVDGYQAASGTLSHDLRPQLSHLAGSGFPMMFGNGITDQILEAEEKGVHNNGGARISIGDLAMFSRPLDAGEMLAIAQSGIDTSSIRRTRNDSRLMGYWPCDVDNSTVIIEDKARAMSPLLGHLTRGDTEVKWDRAYNRDNAQPDEEIFRNDGTAVVDLYAVRTLPPELASYGNLGITSGIFSPQGGSHMGGQIGNNNDSRNTPFNAVARWRPAGEERDLNPQNLFEYVLAFEVTPSGNIPSIDATAHALSADQFWFNSKLHVYGNVGIDTGVALGEVTSFLTTVNADNGSGVTIAFVARDANSTTNITPVISGTLPFGVPSKILFHTKFDEPYRINEFLNGVTPVTVSLWINGQKVNQRTDTSSNLRLWSKEVPDSANAGWGLQFGGYQAITNTATAMLTDGGLGEIYMREIFLMRGIFEDGEVESLANDGIQATVLDGYDNELPTTAVDAGDFFLEGYWRFNGFDGNVGQMSNSPGGSGTTDLSTKGNHLDAIAQRFYEQGTSVDLAETMRAIPGPLASSDLGVQCSGFYNAGISPANTGSNMLPPFAVSGVGFDNPSAGFSVGFLMTKREEGFVNDFHCLMCYGVLTNTPSDGTHADTSLDPNRGWAIGMDSTERMKMVLSTGGNMFLNGGTDLSNSGQIVAGMTRTTQSNPLGDLRDWNNYEHGDYILPSIDAWDHYCWVYNPSPGGSGLRCYLNGVQVDETFIASSDAQNPWTGDVLMPQTPVEPTTRMITFRSHQTAGQTPAAWDFRQNDMVDVDSIMTDVFYFSRPITPEEVRYIAFNGIDAQVVGLSSGIVGGYSRGQDIGSGFVGGYSQGQDTGSGFVGGFFEGVINVSGFIGGFVSGIITGPEGMVGGFVPGQDTGSGFVGGHILGSDTGSGIIGGQVLAAILGSGFIGGEVLGSMLGSGIVGGFALGGLSGSIFFDATYTLTAEAIQDFDGIVQVTTTDSSDFDAKVIVFQDECPPIVTIPTPFGVSGLAIPFSQYFVGKVTPQQGKTITQAKWSFGDFTGDFAVATSGDNCYPISHTFSQSGFYIARLSAIDSDGIHGSTTVFVNASSGINPVIISLSGIPQLGEASLDVDFTTTVDILPPGVIISAKLLTFDDGQSTINNSPSHSYTEPGNFTPIWCVRDSRGVIWCDSLKPGSDKGNLS